MRRRGKSPWLEAEKNRIRTVPTQGIAHRIASGETPFYAWRVESTTTVRKLARDSGIAEDRIDRFERGCAFPHADELEALAKALRVIPELLMAPSAEASNGEPA